MGATRESGFWFLKFYKKFCGVIMQHITLGKKGEAMAVSFLKKKGYKILKTNYVNKIGEIDVICKFKDEIIFVEVKTRTTEKFGLPRESVTVHKQNKIRLTATLYLQSNNMLDQKVRFDVIEVIDQEIVHVIGCF